MFKEIWGHGLQPEHNTSLDFITKHVFPTMQFGREGVRWAGVFFAQLWAWGTGRPASLSLTKEFCLHVQIRSFEWPLFPHWQSNRTLLTLSLISKAISPYYLKNSMIFMASCFLNTIFQIRASLRCSIFCTKIIYGRLSIISKNRCRFMATSFLTTLEIGGAEH